MLPEIVVHVVAGVPYVVAANEAALDMLGFEPKTFDQIPFIGRRQEDLAKTAKLLDAILSETSDGLEMILPDPHIEEGSRDYTNHQHYAVGIFPVGYGVSRIGFINISTTHDLKNRDKLTGLYDGDFGWQWIYTKAKAGKRLVVCFVDIDKFKMFNKIFTHAGGDIVLKAFSSIIAAHIRDGSMVCRYGGDEIIVALVVEDGDDPQKVGESLMRRIQAHLKEELPSKLASLEQMRQELLVPTLTRYMHRKILSIPIPPTFSYGTLVINDPLRQDYTVEGLKKASSALMQAHKDKKDEQLRELRRRAQRERDIRAGKLIFDESDFGNPHWKPNPDYKPRGKKVPQEHKKSPAEHITVL